MSQPFDPYYKWLGIPPSQQPPHHYRLLGVELFETDRDVIDIAANQRMSYLHDLGSGPNGKFSQKLLNEVSSARRCLLDEQQKATYDEQLRAKLASMSAAASAPAPAASPPPTPPPVSKPEPESPPPSAAEPSAELSISVNTTSRGGSRAAKSQSSSGKKTAPTDKPVEFIASATADESDAVAAKSSLRMPVLIGAVGMGLLLVAGAVWVVIAKPWAGAPVTQVVVSAPPPPMRVEPKPEPTVEVAPQMAPPPVPAIAADLEAAVNTKLAEAQGKNDFFKSAIGKSKAPPKTPSATDPTTAGGAAARTVPALTPPAAPPVAPAVIPVARLHLTPQRNAVGDVATLFEVAGTQHLFYAPKLGGKNADAFGHATSTDWLRWTEQPLKCPQPHKQQPLQLGSVVIDSQNTSGLGANAWIAAFTYPVETAPKKFRFDVGIASSVDQGANWTLSPKNPVLKAISPTNRHPRVFWHTASSRWVMILIETSSAAAGTAALLTSADLTTWTAGQRVPLNNAPEWPDLFELSVSGQPQGVWMLTTRSGHYRLGDFDGGQLALTGGGVLQSSNTYFGFRTSSASADPARRVQMAAIRTKTNRGLLSEAAFALPRDITMLKTANGFAPARVWPKELGAWRGKPIAVAAQTLAGNASWAPELSSGSYELSLNFEPGDAAGAAQLLVFGQPISFEFAQDSLVCGNDKAELKGVKNIALLAIVDGPIVELSWNVPGGQMSCVVTPQGRAKPLEFKAGSGTIKLKNASVSELKPPG